MRSPASDVNGVVTGSEFVATGQFHGRSEHALGVYYSRSLKHKELEDVFTSEKVSVFFGVVVI